MFVTNWISTTKIQKISEITNFFRHYFLSRTEVNDDKLEERIFHWARTYAHNPTSSCQVYLLDLEVDKVEWHDSRYYEDLYFLLNGMKYGMRDITLTKEILGFYYWNGKCDVSDITTEGLVEKGIVSKITPYVVTHTKIDKLTVK